jgi:dynein light intermediate chain
MSTKKEERKKQDIKTKKEEEKKQDIKKKSQKETIKNNNNNETSNRPKTKNISTRKSKKKYDKKQNNFSGGIESFINVSNNPPPELMTSSSSLIKYETPFLVSSTVSNKKLLAELDQNNEESEMFLKKIINTFSIDSTDYSLKDTLNKILPPKKVKTGDQMWVQYVSCNPVTRAEVVNLSDNLKRHLELDGARMNGVCPIRERLYDECFHELIRQITINCLERGILLMRIKNETAMTINTYKILYESCVTYGMRTFMSADKEKNSLTKKIYKLEDDCQNLEENIKELEQVLEEKKVQDKVEHDKIINEHEKAVEELKRMSNLYKNDIKDRLSYHN